MPETISIEKNLNDSEVLLSLIDKKLEWIKSNDRFQFYEPNVPIEKVISLVGSKDNLLYIASLANGVGKTTFLVNMLRAIMFGPANPYFRFPKFEKWPYPKRLRI